MMPDTPGRFLPIARIHRARETVLEQAARAQRAAVRRTEQALAEKREAVEKVKRDIAALAEMRCKRRMTDTDDLARFDLRMIAACAARTAALDAVEAALADLAREQGRYRQLMKQMMREHEFVDVAMSQHRKESRRLAQKLEIAGEELISDSSSPANLSMSQS
jgi:hypothetical protein